VYVATLVTTLPELAGKMRIPVTTVALDLPNKVWTETEYCNVDGQSVLRPRLDKHVPVNTQKWKLCSLWAVLQLVAR
jgi:hypothetical protein